jgi:hypothetical protein
VLVIVDGSGIVRETYDCHFGEHLEVVALCHGCARLHVPHFGLAEARNGVKLTLISWTLGMEWRITYTVQFEFEAFPSGEEKVAQPHQLTYASNYAIKNTRPFKLVASM